MIVILADVDAGQHDFLKAFNQHLSQLKLEVFNRQAPTRPACLPDDAVGASIITPILNLQASPRAVDGGRGRPGQHSTFVNFRNAHNRNVPLAGEGNVQVPSPLAGESNVQVPSPLAGESNVQV